jgi:hypothetical protein
MNLDELRKEAAQKNLLIRTCWECNTAHEHLRARTEHAPLHCFACGKLYYKGVVIGLTNSMLDSPAVAELSKAIAAGAGGPGQALQVEDIDLKPTGDSK